MSTPKPSPGEPWTGPFPSVKDTPPGYDNKEKPYEGAELRVPAGSRAYFAGWSHCDELINFKITGKGNKWSYTLTNSYSGNRKVGLQCEGRHVVVYDPNDDEAENLELKTHEIAGRGQASPCAYAVVAEAKEGPFRYTWYNVHSFGGYGKDLFFVRELSATILVTVVELNLGCPIYKRVGEGANYFGNFASFQEETPNRPVDDKDGELRVQVDYNWETVSRSQYQGGLVQEDAYLTGDVKIGKPQFISLSVPDKSLASSNKLVHDQVDVRSYLAYSNAGDPESKSTLGFNGYSELLSSWQVRDAIAATQPWKNFRTASILISNPAATSECVTFVAAALSNGAQAWKNGPRAGQFVHEDSTLQIVGALAGKPRDGINRHAAYGARMMGPHKVTKSDG
jgi:hypothetical protein